MRKSLIFLHDFTDELQNHLPKFKEEKILLDLYFIFFMFIFH